MRILFLVQSDFTHQHLRSRFSQYEVAPFAANERAIRIVLGSFEADVAVIDPEATWASRIEQTLSNLGVKVVHFDGDFQTIDEVISKLAADFDDEEYDDPEPTGEPLEKYTPTINTARYDLEIIHPIEEEEHPVHPYFKQRELLKEGVTPSEITESEEAHLVKESDRQQEEDADPEPIQPPQKPKGKLRDKAHLPKLPAIPKISPPKLPKIKIPSLPQIKFPTSPATEIDPTQEIDLSLVETESRIVYQDKVVGTAVIAVMGISHGVGTTHTATLIANYLARHKERVALVEACDSYAFARIERLYHAVPEGAILQTDHFEAFGVHYFKSGDQLDLIQLFSAGFTFIVLDLGSHDTSDHFKEFLRAGISVLVGAGSEWKHQDIYRFCRQNRKRNQQNWNIAIPLVEDESIKDIKKGMETAVKQVVAIPYHPDPFSKQAETDETMKRLLQLHGKRRGLFFGKR
ncbi:hypothetical protein [Paenibacillus jiagnxiensis]|uniref:hypothetical protein n=1 Tax=Paenibacillus jiagnxiensis TaxID=3228926 RepID=UPI0033B9D3E6